MNWSGLRGILLGCRPFAARHEVEPRSTVEVIKPPITAIAIGARKSASAPLRTISGVGQETIPTMLVVISSDVCANGARPASRPLERHEAGQDP